MRLLTATLPTGRNLRRRAPHLYDGKCWVCDGGEEETARHWRFDCGGDGVAVGIRERMMGEVKGRLEEHLGDEGWARAWGVVRSAERGKPWEEPTHIEHVPERRWVTRAGDVMTVTHPDGEGGQEKIRADRYWERRKWWKAGWEDDGRAFVGALHTAWRP